MIRVGLTGGIGSGKTTVAGFFRELGVPVYNSDERARALMEEDDGLREAIIGLLGPEAYGESGLDRGGGGGHPGRAAGRRPDHRAGARDTHPQDAGNGTRPAAPAGTAIHRFFRARGPFQGARILILSQRGPMMRSIRRLCLRACGFHHPVAYSVTGFGYTVQLEISVE